MNVRAALTDGNGPSGRSATHLFPEKPTQRRARHSGLVAELLCVGSIRTVHDFALQLLFVLDQVVQRTGFFHRLA